MTRIDKILRDFRGLKDIAGIKAPRRKKGIDEMTDSEGNTVADKQGIADVFADFYEKLYSVSADTIAGASTSFNTDSELDPFTLEELKDALKNMKRHKAQDESGIIAEMMKDGSANLLSAILDVYNDVLLRKDTPPAHWKSTKLVVIFKKNDPKAPGNYRPIAVIPILYKLFSRMFCNRLMRHIMPHQSVDQAAYRKGFSTDDHLLTVSMLIEKSWEYKCPLWIALVDFEKAFDTVDHIALWQVLVDQGVPRHYIGLLSSLYEGQVAYVQAGAKSRSFRINRGVKQGDPISALLFIAIMQASFSDLQSKWQRLDARRTGVKYGIEFPQGQPTNLRLADDVILVAQQRSDIRKMLIDLRQTASKYGLKIHMGKTKVMTWSALVNGSSQVSLDGDRRNFR